MTAEDKAKVLELTRAIAKVIGKEKPIIAAQACLNIIQASADLEGAAQRSGDGHSGAADCAAQRRNNRRMKAVRVD